MVSERYSCDCLLRFNGTAIAIQLVSSESLGRQTKSGDEQMRANYSYSNKVYLDQLPEFESIIRDYIDSLCPNYSDGYLIKKIDSIECRSRDGFSAHSHNCGGFDKSWVTDLSSIWGSGAGVGKYDQTSADNEYDEARETFIKYDASEETKALLALMPEDKRDYHGLIESGQDEIAEKMDEYCRDYLTSSHIWFGYRAMYEGSANGWHTLVIYAAVNLSEYEGPMGKGGDTLAEIEIKFRNVTELSKKLEQARSELESAI